MWSLSGIVLLSSLAQKKPLSIFIEMSRNGGYCGSSEGWRADKVNIREKQHVKGGHGGGLIWSYSFKIIDLSLSSLSKQSPQNQQTI